jgi:phosphohistidine phosphatase
MTQTLMLLRHARAESWRPGADDAGRVLSEEGERHAQAVADWFAEHLAPPDHARCSPAARTRGTLEPLLSRLPMLRGRTAWDEALYLASAGDLHAVAGRAFDVHDRVLLVGHNPGIDGLLRTVTRADDLHGRGGMSPGRLAVVEFQQGWAEDAGDGRLVHWVGREDLGVD